MDDVDRPFDSRSGFQDALQLAFGHIAAAGCRTVFLSDDDFADWPLGDPVLVDRLTDWARSHREIHLVARSFDGFARRHPRWVRWRQHWSHVVHCRSVAELTDTSAGGGGAVVTVPSLLVAPGLLALRLADRLRYRGRLSTQADDIQRCQSLFDALSQQSADAFPATTLGL